MIVSGITKMVRKECVFGRGSSLSENELREYGQRRQQVPVGQNLNSSFAVLVDDHHPVQRPPTEVQVLDSPTLSFDAVWSVTSVFGHGRGGRSR
jgi:hypothetical protein